MNLTVTIKDANFYELGEEVERIALLVTRGNYTVVSYYPNYVQAINALQDVLMEENRKAIEEMVLPSGK